MLKFSGSSDRTFSFPAPRPQAFEFFAKIERIVSLIADIEITAVSSSDPGVVRLSYTSNEMGVYEVRTICDVLTQIDPKTFEIRLIPASAADFPPVNGEMTPRRSVSTGEINATLTCMDDNGETTMIRYQFAMISKVPVVGMMRFVPLRPIEEMVQNLINSRLKEQVDQFINNAIKVYSTQQEEQ